MDDSSDELAPGTELLHGQYRIVSFLNAGGFGITYRAVDSLDRPVVIKECFPGAFCRRSRAIVQPRSRAHANEFDGIVRLFVEEARSLSKLQHPNIVGVHQVFEENDTAYMALDFVEGRDLLDILEDPNSDLPPDQIVSILDDMLDAIRFVHAQGMLHRDISPDNILIDATGKPVLIDFGAARQQAQKQSRVLSAMRVVKDGYSPQEFYITGSEQGPFSDLYAMGASFYHLISREVPPDSQRRLTAIATGDPDPYVPLLGRFPDYDQSVLASIDKALSILPRDRMQSAGEWLAAMSGQAAPPQPAPARKPVAANAPEAPKKGKGLLFAGVAVVAVAAGLGYVLTQGGNNVPAPGQPAAEIAAAPVESVPMVAAPQRIDETSFAVASSGGNGAPALATTAPAAPADPVAAAEPSLSRPEISETAPVVDETPPAALAAAPAIDTAPAAPAFEESTPEPAPQVLAPDLSPRPVIRPPEAAYALLPDPQPTPAAAADPDGATVLSAPRRSAPAEQIQTAALPQEPAPGPRGWDGLQQVSAELPGAEILPEPEPARAVEGNWTLALPFADLRVDEQGRSWVLSVDGAPVADRAAFDSLVARGYDLATVESVDVTMGIGPRGQAESLVQTTTLAPVYDMTMAGGMKFRARRGPDGWITRVVTVPEGSGGDLQVGDVLIGSMDTGLPFSGPTSVADKIEQAAGKGVESLNFAVTRDGSTWVASLAVPRLD
ncbi:serine/threonine-protein kinase [Jannaschia formosa]|uniref:serine/threonine-protein kinase n=1 Tax=Jannaschia formosa TaxID=2259592 RepID=UPI001FD8286D|nr:serine/threonine-protein kinase [Jannaschia formosa]